MQTKRSAIFTSRISGRGKIYGSVRLSVCLCLCESLDLWNQNLGTHNKDYHIWDEFEGQGHRSKVKVKNVKIPVLGLVSEKAALSQGHEGQGHKGQRSRQKVEGQGCRVKVKAVGGVLYPIDSREV